MKYVSNYHCLNCKKSMHITGDITYVSLETNRFCVLHSSHELIPLPLDERWEGLDNGTDWNNACYWEDKAISEEYQKFLEDSKLKLGIKTQN